METVSKSVLKAKMLEYLRCVEETGEELVVTSHGKPVVRILPYKKKASTDAVFNELRGKVVYYGDILKPSTDEWDET